MNYNNETALMTAQNFVFPAMVDKPLSVLSFITMLPMLIGRQDRNTMKILLPIVRHMTENVGKDYREAFVSFVK